MDTGQAGNFDLLVTVEAPEDLRLDRAVARGGLTRAEAAARMAAQVSSEERREAAGVVIENGGSLEELKRSTAELAGEIRRLAGSRT